MDAIALNLTPGDLTTLLVIAVILVVGLVALRIIFKLTAALFRAGCIAIIIIVGLAFFLLVG